MVTYSGNLRPQLVSSTGNSQAFYGSYIECETPHSWTVSPQSTSTSEWKACTTFRQTLATGSVEGQSKSKSGPSYLRISDIVFFVVSLMTCSRPSWTLPLGHKGHYWYKWWGFNALNVSCIPAIIIIKALWFEGGAKQKTSNPPYLSIQIFDQTLSAL